MAEYINREKTKRELSEWCISLNSPHLLSRDDTMFLLDNIPAADVAQVVHGRWLCVDTDTDQFFLCNRCKKKEYWESNYCPNCGAKMDGDDDAKEN